jgi:hypothetical protein
VKHYFLRSILLIFVISTTTLRAQQSGWEVGGLVGTTYYLGDLNTNFDFTHPGPSVSAFGRYNFNPRLSLKFGASYGTISADDAYSKNTFERLRNLSFRSPILDGAMQFEFNFMPLIYGSREQWFTPYLFLGVNVFYFNPQTKYEGKWYSLRGLGTEGQFRGEEYYAVQGGLVYGGGFRFALNESWGLNIEASARRLYTDYLDDVSTDYPNMNDLLRQRGPLAVTLADRSLPNENGKKLGQLGRQRGENNRNDTYTFLGIGVVYYFGDLKCPPLLRY